MRCGGGGGGSAEAAQAAYNSVDVNLWRIWTACPLAVCPHQKV